MPRQKLYGGVTVGGFAMIGLAMVLVSQAATPFIAAEVESGNLAGQVASISDSGASGGSAVQFGLASSNSWPATPPAQICGNSSILGNGPTSAPAGAIVVPAGDNSNLVPNWMTNGFSTPNKTFWFAPGVHTLGNGMYDQIGPGNGSTFVGAPGAIIDGQRLNNYAFSGKNTNVIIRYLTIRGFNSPTDQGVVNHDAASNWTIEYSTITDNRGAGLMAGSNNIYRYNCMKENGQYAINGCCGGETDATDIQNWTLDHNEIVGNNADDLENVIPGGCGCTGGVKFWLNKNVTVTNNWVHGNKSVGLWLDNNNRGFVIENNYIENNDAEGLFIEAGYDAQVRNNTFKRNAIVKGREFRSRSDPFPIAAIYVSDNGAPSGYGLASPMYISGNYFEDNWSGVAMWENADRYSGSGAHTHISGTIKVGSLYTDAACAGPGDTIPASVGDKYKCRWSTENVIVENNDFRINKSAVGTGCAGADFCGVNGIFSNSGSFPEFSGYTIPWRITFQQGNIFRNNRYVGDWKFQGFQTTKPGGMRYTWAEWRAPAPAVPTVFTHDNRPQSFGQDVGSTLTP